MGCEVVAENVWKEETNLARVSKVGVQVLDRAAAHETDSEPGNLGRRCNSSFIAIIYFPCIQESRLLIVLLEASQSCTSKGLQRIPRCRPVVRVKGLTPCQ